MSKFHRRSFEIRHHLEGKPVPIVSEALMATRGLADGRLIPVVILDTTERPDIESMIRAHDPVGLGDVSSAWGVRSRFDSSHLRLLLTVSKPSLCTVLIEFLTVTHGGVIDQIVRAQGLYIQPGRPGDRARSTLDNPRILVEVPSRNFQPTWEQLFRKELTSTFRHQGLSRSDAKRAAAEFLSTWRMALSETRIPSNFDI